MQNPFLPPLMPLLALREVRDPKPARYDGLRPTCLFLPVEHRHGLGERMCWLSWLRALILLLDVIKGRRRGHASGLLLCDFLGLGHGASSACGRLRAGIVLEPGELLGGSLRGSHRHSLRGFQRHLARRSPGPWSGFAFRRCLRPHGALGGHAPRFGDAAHAALPPGQRTFGGLTAAPGLTWRDGGGRLCPMRRLLVILLDWARGL
mmetsp:Transcript_8945/g.21228  ORF Transcript_8945/g.21228 Transcript_8945/m.21228 type:complete len:206 (+) Transcript_8945:327-944(+)